LEPVDISLGGLRIYSHEEHPLGSLLRLDVFFPHFASVTLTAQVMWSRAQGKGAPARFDLGLAFVGVPPDVKNLLETWLGAEDDVIPRESGFDLSPTTPGAKRDAPSILSAIPVVVADAETLRLARLGRAGHLLWLIDGVMNVETILSLMRKPVEGTLTLLEDLLEQGIIKLRWSTLSPKGRGPEEQGSASTSAVIGAIDLPSPSKKKHNPVAEMHDCFSRGDYVSALAIVDLLLAVHPDDRLARQFRATCCAALEDVYALRIGPLDRIPVVVTLPEPMGRLGIDRPGLLLSLMDGSSTLEAILNVCGIPRLDALRVLQGLVQKGNIAFK
jgi:hypothetical protein